MKTKVKELRTGAGMTQQQLAERVRVSARTIISIEKTDKLWTSKKTRRHSENT